MELSLTNDICGKIKLPFQGEKKTLQNQFTRGVAIGQKYNRLSAILYRKKQKVSVLIINPSRWKGNLFKQRILHPEWFRRWNLALKGQINSTSMAKPRVKHQTFNVRPERAAYFTKNKNAL